MSVTKRTRAWLAAGLTALTVIAGAALGQNVASAADTSDDPATAAARLCAHNTATILDLPHKIFAAWDAQNPAGIAAVFTPDANFIPTSGAYLQGPSAITSYYTAAFAGPLKGTGMIGKPSLLRCVAPSVAVVDGLGGIVLPGETYTDPATVPIGRRLIVSWTAVPYGSPPVWKMTEFQATMIAG